MKVAGDDDVARTHVLAEECRRLKADSGLNKISSPSVEALGFDISALPGLELLPTTLLRPRKKAQPFPTPEEPVTKLSVSGRFEKNVAFKFD